MTLWFLRGVMRGVVTTRYPRTPPDRWTHTLVGPPVFAVARLDEAVADLLVRSCPSGALRRDGAELVFDVGACTCCGVCAAIAPEAVGTGHEQELAATRRTDLIKRLPIRGGGR